MSEQQDALKHEAAMRAIDYVRDGMVVGLGTGTTAEHATRGLGKRVAQEGLRIVGIPTSEKTAALARELGIPLASLDEQPYIDLTIDGADEADLATFNLIKGRGGALLREKIVAQSTREEIIIVDESKLVSRLGEHDPVPVEVLPFGHRYAVDSLVSLGATPHLRETAPGTPYITDSGNYIFDCSFPGIDDAPALAAAIKAITGVIEHGLFIGLAARIIIASPGGVRVVEKPG